MKKQKKLVVANWKMNPPSLNEAKDLVKDVKRTARNLRKTNVCICPPFVYLLPLAKLVNKPLYLGAQNAHHEYLGAFTGEISFSELPQFGVDYVILGHSERRKMGETDEVINKKVKSVVNANMTAILCVGESSRDQNGEFYNLIKQQIQTGLRDVSKKSADNVVIAYEPIWAIGAKEAMHPRDLHEMSIFIRKVLKDMYGISADYIRILYGGTADRVNADSLVRDGNVSGLLVGRESLRSKDFIEILKLVDSV